MMEFEYTHMGKSQRARLGEGKHLLGRSPRAALLIVAPEVSSRHAQLRISDGRLWLRDLGSRNGTKIDAVPLSAEQGEVEVLPGQSIWIADIEVRQDPGHGTSPIPERNADELTEISFSIDQTFGESAHFRITAELSGLFELIATEEGAEVLACRACEFVSACVQADSVVLLEDQGEGTAPVPLGSWSSGGRATEDLRLSRTMIARVIDDRTSISYRSIDGDSGISSESILAMGIRSAMAVPLFDNERVRGILYVDSLGKSGSYSQDDLQLVTATANAVGVKLRNISMEREQATAAKIQKSMLPETLPEIAGHDLLVHIDMCRAVGGDFYHALPFVDGRILIALGDVTGKGMPAALIMSACMVLIGTLAEICDSVEAIAEHIHRQLFKVTTASQFVTLFLGDLDPATGTLTYVNAGHEPPLLVEGFGAITALPSTMLPLAMFKDLAAAAASIRLAPGDLLAVFSDGISEATLDGDAFLGLEGVKEILSAKREQALAAIRDAIGSLVTSYLGGSHPSDDISLMLLRRQPGLAHRAKE